jgi:cell division transport system permease protein
LIKITNTVKFSALAFLSAQFLVVFFIIFATITFKIVAKKEEIEIMRLLGATRYFIIKPFLKQNLLINFAATVFSSTAFVSIYLSMQGQIHAFLSGIPSLNLLRTSYITIDVWPPNFYLFAALSAMTYFIGYFLIYVTTSFAASKYIK